MWKQASPRMCSFSKMHRRRGGHAHDVTDDDNDEAHFRITCKMYFISHLFLLTVAFLLDWLGLRNGKTLHGLVFLLLRLVLVWLLLILAVRVDQHSAVECVAVSSGTLAGPRDTIHYREGKECWWSFFTVASCEFYCNQILQNREAEEVHWRSKTGYNSASERHKDRVKVKSEKVCKGRKWLLGRAQ